MKYNAETVTLRLRQLLVAGPALFILGLSAPAPAETFRLARSSDGVIRRAILCKDEA
jgi:hypothetical protein